MTNKGEPFPPCRDLSDLTSPFRSKARELLRQLAARCTPQGYRCGAAETKRSEERQAWLFSRNAPGHWVTDCDGIVNVSKHQTGDAMDVYIVGLDGKYLPARHVAWTWLREIAERLGLRVLRKEKCHVELC